MTQTDFKPKNEKELQKELKRLYRKWPLVKSYLHPMGCSKTEAEDIFQEALLIFCKKVNDPDFDLNVEPIHYVKSTSRLLWMNQARKNQKQATSSTEQIEITEEESTWLEKENQLNVLESVIADLGKKCQDLLSLFYGGKLSMVEIAKKLDFRNDKVAKAQKYRCITKAKEIYSELQTSNQ